MSMMSSTNNRWVSLSESSVQPSPLCCQTGRRGERAQSRVAIKRRPDSGAPCFDPLARFMGVSAAQP